MTDGEYHNIFAVCSVYNDMRAVRMYADGRIDFSSFTRRSRIISQQSEYVFKSRMVSFGL